jgi:hypothetical protein
LFELLRGGVPRLEDAAWRSLLKFADETQCTLFLHAAQGLPDWFTKEIEARLARNADRRKRLLQAYQETSGALRAGGLDFVLLKSFTHEHGFGIEGAQRVQYDLDFFLTASDLAAADAALREIGYAPHGTSELSELHGRPLIKPSTWRWRGDYYDPEMPIPLELHTGLWHSESDRLLAPGVDAFWGRRTTTRACGLQVPALAEPDRVAFAALHVLRHILHNNVRPSHVLELARFLATRAGDSLFWESWRNLHDPGLRTLETISFRFAREWFRCPFPDALEDTWREMSPAVRSWFERFAFSPVVNLLQPNKDVVWLHAALLPNARDRWSVLAKRLVPLRLPDQGEAEGASYSGRFFRRARYHARALASALWNGVRWRWAASSTASETSDWKRPSV